MGRLRDGSCEVVEGEVELACCTTVAARVGLELGPTRAVDAVEGSVRCVGRTGQRDVDSGREHSDAEASGLAFRVVEAGALDHAADVDARHDLSEHRHQVCTRERLRR
jgi:hypothetical protein